MKRRRRKAVVCAYVPSDVLEQVFKGLPAKSLLRFRCVCKQWRSVIDDPRFINLHRIASYGRPGGVKFLRGYKEFIRKKVPGNDLLYRLVDLDRKTENQRYQRLNRDLEIGEFGCGAQGVEGLVCDVDHAVWNPTTRKRLCLPQHQDDDIGVCGWGLGFDSETSEYKVVHLLQDLDLNVWIQVLTLGTNNAWRNINTDTVPAEVLMNSCMDHGIYAQNKIYFPVMKYHNIFLGVLVLWVGEERLQFVAAPKGMDNETIWVSWTTIVFGNTIALVPTVYRNDQVPVGWRIRYEVWILCDLQTQRWDCVVYEDQTMFDLTINNVVCLMDDSNTEEVLVEGPGGGSRALVEYRSTFYWDVRRRRTRKGPDHKGEAQIYTKQVETLFDPTLVKA